MSVFKVTAGEQVDLETAWSHITATYQLEKFSLIIKCHAYLRKTMALLLYPRKSNIIYNSVSIKNC